MKNMKKFLQTYPNGNTYEGKETADLRRLAAHYNVILSDMAVGDKFRYTYHGGVPVEVVRTA